MRGLCGKTAVVTGGAQGIGRAVSDRLVSEGAAVTIVDVAEEHGRVAEKELAAEGGSVLFVPTDIGDESSIEAAVAHTIDRFGRIDLLVNCAAVFIMRGVEATVDEWRRIMDVNIMGQA